MQCRTCGAQLPEGSRFCGACGAAQPADQTPLIGAVPEKQRRLPRFVLPLILLCLSAGAIIGILTATLHSRNKKEGEGSRAVIYYVSEEDYVQIVGYESDECASMREGSEKWEQLHATGKLGSFETDAVHVVVPSKIDGSPVTEISVNAFHGCTQIETVEIPSSVTQIASNAFNGCSADLVIICEPGSAAELVAGAAGIETQQREPQPTEAMQSEPPTEATQSEPPTEPEPTEPEALITYEMKSERPELTASDGTLCYYAEMEYPVFRGSGGAVDALNRRIGEACENGRTYETSADEILELAREGLGGLNSLPYYSNFSVTVPLLRGELISLRWFSIDWWGGMHAYSSVVGITCDARSGEELPLERFLPASEEQITELANQYGESPIYESGYREGFYLSQTGVVLIYWFGDAFPRDEVEIPYTDPEACFVDAAALLGTVGETLDEAFLVCTGYEGSDMEAEVRASYEYEVIAGKACRVREVYFSNFATRETDRSMVEVRRVEYEYDDQGRCIRRTETVRAADGSNPQTSVWITTMFSKDGQPAVRNLVSEDLEVLRSTYDSYSDDGLLLEENTYDAAGLLIAYDRYEYDDRGRPLTRVYKTEDSTERTAVYAYDANGNGRITEDGDVTELEFDGFGYLQRESCWYYEYNYQYDVLCP